MAEIAYVIFVGGGGGYGCLTIKRAAAPRDPPVLTPMNKQGCFVCLIYPVVRIDTKIVVLCIDTKIFVSPRSYMEEKNQGDYLCQICGTSFELN